MMEKPVWTNANRINHANQFVPRPVQLKTGRPDINSVRININTGRIAKMFAEIVDFLGGSNLSSKSGGWDQFGSNIATAMICLSTGRVYNFSKLIFDGMVANLKSKTKFLMYPRFLQLILDIQTENKHPYLVMTLTKKIFGNMKRGFRGAPRPLLSAMLLVATTNPSAGQEHPDVAQSQPSSSKIPVPSTSLPPEQSPPPINAPIPASTPIPIPETDPEPMEHTFEEPSPAHQHFSPL
ncbi:hypothetical protein Tco_0359448 [Tanacetum coccineum]